jgi:hypothetical protein
LEEDYATVRASPPVLSMCVCDPAKAFLTFKFGYLLFCNPPPNNKTETGTANRLVVLKVGSTKIANHLD